MVVAVFGAAGQLGQSMQSIKENFPTMDFHFFASKDCDITSIEAVERAFESCKPDYCINAAAYTAVDKAESEPEIAFAINATGAKNLAEISTKYNCTLIHISTDFIFDGTSKIPYIESAATNPLGVYGETKLQGEKFVQAFAKRHYIIRTSWVYSEFGSNFYKTMLRLSADRDKISVVDDQIGCPTNAVNLAKAILKIIQKDAENPSDTNYGIYNYSDDWQCSWFEFAKKIFEDNNVTIIVDPIPSSAYPTPAERPKYSVLDTMKIKIFLEK